MNVLHQVSFDGSKCSRSGQIPGHVLLPLRPSHLRTSFALEGSRRALHRSNGVGTFVTDFNMQIHDVVHKPSSGLRFAFIVDPFEKPR